jgi:hypothetical protein
VDGWQGIYFVLCALLFSAFLVLDLAAFLWGVVVFGRFVDGVGVRHAEDGGAELFLVVVQDV